MVDEFAADDTEPADPPPLALASGLDDALSPDALALAKALAKRKLFREGSPEKIDRFVVIRKLGEGGMGVVYAAYDPALDRKVALKLLRGLGGDEPRMARLVREAKAMARVTHPNVITVHEVGTCDHGVFVAMELLDGVTLREWLDQHERRWPELGEVFVAIARGLAAAHRSGLVHRDFKPENVMIGHDGHVNILDFGLAKYIGTDSASEADGLDSLAEPAMTEPLTRTGAVFGTPAYMSPEQHRGHPVDERSDQYSYCVTMFEAIFGHRPFMAQTYPALVRLVLGGQLEPPPKRGDIPTRTYRALLRGLSVEPSERFDSMDALLVEIEHRSKWRSRARLALVGGGIAAAAFAVGSGIVERDPSCVSAESVIRAAMDEERLEAGRRSFAATKLPFAERSWSSVEQAMGGYAERWATQYESLCESDTTLRSDERTARLSCLEGGARTIETLTDLFTRADATTVERAVSAVSAIRSPEQCAAGDPWRNHLRIPEGKEQRADVLQARIELVYAMAIADAGKLEAGLDVARGTLDSPVAQWFEPLFAEASLHVGQLEQRAGSFLAAEAALADAAYAGIKVGDSPLATEAATDLVRVVGRDRAAFDEAVTWARLAEATMGGNAPPESRARIDLAMSEIFVVAGRFDEALARARSATRVLSNRTPRNDSFLVRSLLRVGELELLSGDFEACRATHELAEQAAAQAHDDDLRLVMRSVYDHRGELEFVVGNYQHARDFWARGWTLSERQLGSEHPAVAAGLVSVARADWALGNHDAATETLERAIALGVTTTDERVAVDALRLKGQLAIADQRLPMAARTLDRALAKARHWGAASPLIAEVLLDIAEVSLIDSDPRGAQQRLRQVHEIAKTAWTATHPSRARLTWLSAWASMLEGHAVSARATLEHVEDELVECCADSQLLVAVRRTLAEAGLPRRGSPQRSTSAPSRGP